MAPRTCSAIFGPWTPDAFVTTGQGLTIQSTGTDTTLPLALGVAAFVTVAVIGVLFLITLIGLDLSTIQHEIGLLTALGFSARHRSLLLVLDTLAVSIAGSILGTALGYGLIQALNRVGHSHLGIDTIALFHPALIGIGVGTGLIIGFFAAPYPMLIEWRTDPAEVLNR